SASKNNRGLTRKPRISEEPLKKRRKNRDRKSKNPHLIQMELCYINGVEIRGHTAYLQMRRREKELASN
ncbi:MAG: hypothetical protein M3255_03375, partial [Pseudomonadota bacterium]|nr:hypothetical protein [Pseudomonadota bacterium]